MRDERSEGAAAARAGGSRARAARVLRIAAWAVPLALLLAVLEAWQGRFLYPEPRGWDYWKVALGLTLPSWLTLLLVAPLVPAWVGHWRARGAKGAAWVPLHAAGGAVFVLLHLGFMALLVPWSPVQRTVADEFRVLLGRYATAELVTYAALAGVAHVTAALTAARDAERARLELGEALARAELARLREQLDPHFLFNALNSVMALAERRDFDGVRDAVDRLATLLRRSLQSREVAETSLGEELEFAADYLALQQLRHGDGLRVEFDVAPEARAARVPTLLLQPLVENAVRHGRSGAPGGDCVRVSAVRTADRLRVRVEDTGPGFGAGAGSGIGLETTRRRLALRYGDRHALRTGNGAAGGAFVEVEIPQEPA